MVLVGREYIDSTYLVVDSSLGLDNRSVSTSTEKVSRETPTGTEEFGDILNIVALYDKTLPA
jgi:hypothetical protein